jgi:glycosyltransferase involved in cell wall biosynthesis
MSAPPRCSVVMPLFNMAATVAEALDSCAAQDIPDLEVIVVDDGSSDGSARIAAAHALRPTVIEIEHTGVPAAVRNVGILAATGQHIQFLDADDVIAPRKMARQLGALAGLSADTVAYSDYAYFSEVGGRRIVERRGPPDGDYWPSDLASQFALYTVLHRFLFPRRALLRIGLFDPGLTHAEDLDLWLRLTISGVPFVYQPETLALYREHVSHSLSFPMQERRCRVVVARKLRGYLSSQRVYEGYANVVDEIERREVFALKALTDQAAARSRHDGRP